MTQNYLTSLGFDSERMKVITTQKNENIICVYLESERRLTSKLASFLRDLGYVVRLESNSKFGRVKK
jgi:hypothetical protein